VEFLDLIEDAEENLQLENLPLEILDTGFKPLKIRRLWSSWIDRGHAEENLPLENLPLEIRDDILKSLKIRRRWSS
jgi:hypothetical protein